MSARPVVESSRTPFPSQLRDPKIYDLLASSPLVIFYGIFVAVNAPLIAHEFAKLGSSPASFVLLIDLLSRTAVLLFAALLIAMVCTRKPAAARARGVFPRAVATLGAYLGTAVLALPRQHLDWEFQLLSAALIAGGMGFALWSLSRLGRSFSIMSEARTLVTDGPYAFVRHPLYVGEMLSLIGTALQYISPVAVILLVVQFLFQLRRMGFEEAILAKTFPEYAGYKARTARLIPGIY